MLTDENRVDVLAMSCDCTSTCDELCCIRVRRDCVCRYTYLADAKVLRALQRVTAGLHMWHRDGGRAIFLSDHIS